jgi:hypothetical protein
MHTRHRSVSYRARRIHRWLGLTIGIQFLLWTLGGLYFSWTRLAAVHGDHLMRERPQLPVGAPVVSPSVVVEILRQHERVDSLAGAALTMVLAQPTWRVDYFTTEHGRVVTRRRMADAVTGALREPLGRDEAVAAAREVYTGTKPVVGVEYVTDSTVDGHHEYRGQPLPAWAVRFGDTEGATAYVAAELGEVIRIRNDRWRTFDFLWMLHTMDYRGRDDFNNLALRAFSLLGLVTVLSGFTLFVLTSRPVLRRRHERFEAELHDGSARA